MSLQAIHILPSAGLPVSVFSNSSHMVRLSWLKLCVTFEPPKEGFKPFLNLFLGIEEVALFATIGHFI